MNTGPMGGRSAATLRTSQLKPLKAQSIFMSGLEAHGVFCFPIPKTLRRCARPNLDSMAKLKPEFDERDV